MQQVPQWWKWIPGDEWEHPIGSASVVEHPDRNEWVAAVRRSGAHWDFLIREGTLSIECSGFPDEESARAACVHMYVAACGALGRNPRPEAPIRG